jgi:hypothetical protein
MSPISPVDKNPLFVGDAWNVYGSEQAESGCRNNDSMKQHGDRGGEIDFGGSETANHWFSFDPELVGPGQFFNTTKGEWLG